MTHWQEDAITGGELPDTPVRSTRHRKVFWLRILVILPWSAVLIGSRPADWFPWPLYLALGLVMAWCTGLALNAWAWKDFHRDWYYREGWFDGRMDMGGSLVSAMERGHTVPVWLTALVVADCQQQGISEEMLDRIIAAGSED